MSEEEQPRPSLRLRKTPDRPPGAPPEAPKGEPPEPAAPPAPAADSAPRMRLSSIIKPGSGESAPAMPPSPPPAPPSAPPEPVVQAAPPPVVIPEAAPAPSPLFQPPPPVIPAPTPASVAQPPASSPPQEVTPPVAAPPRPLKFPPPPNGKPEPKDEPNGEPNDAPKPPSPRTVGLVLFSIAILVLGGAAYLFFMDPFGLFKDEEPARAAAPPVSTPAATPASTPAAPPPQAATPSPAESTAEFKMPEPTQLAAGEEIAPGVVRLPPDAAQTSMPPLAALPEERTYEPPAPKPNPAYTALVNNLNITGIRANTSGGFLMVGTLLHRPGDIVDVQSKLEFVSIDGPVITFRDPHGALYTRRF